MEINGLQKEIDDWIQEFGVRYYDILTNTILLNEEVGELSGVLARVYGEQSFKSSLSDTEQSQRIADELGDVLFVVFCIANQLNIDIESVMKSNLHKKTNRDKTRHRNNPKLQ